MKLSIFARSINNRSIQVTMGNGEEITALRAKEFKRQAAEAHE